MSRNPRLRMKAKLMSFTLLFLLLCGNLSAATKDYVKPRLGVMAYETKNVEPATVQSVTELTQSLMENSGLYTVIERAQIDKVLQEQVFQYSGSVDQTTAIEIGKMLGAEKLVLGSINKVGEKYVLNGRIVNVETGEVEISGTRVCNSALGLNDATLSLSKILLKKDRTEAQRSLSLAFPRQGTWAVYLSAMSPVIATPDDTALHDSFNVDYLGSGSQILSYGIGFKYFAGRVVFFDLGILPSGVSQKMSLRMTDAGETWEGTAQVPQSPVLTGSVNALIDVTRRTKLIAGGGFTLVTYQIQNRGHTFPSNAGISWIAEGAKDYLLPFANTGIEWSFNENLRISLIGNFYLPREDIHTSNAYIWRPGNFGTANYEIRKLQAKANPVTFRTAVSYYF